MQTDKDDSPASCAPNNAAAAATQRRRACAVHSSDDDDDILFNKLEQENACLPPQDSTMFILAQIERQNALLENDPKSISLHANERKAQLAPVQQKQQQDDDDDIWEAVIQDFDRVAIMTPHLLSVKLRAGIAPRVRGVCWQAMCKSASLHLETVYGQLCNEQSPHERIIQRDLARTFPCIDMFKQENGAGQLAMRRVLEAYSLYDSEVGYCQGLAFLVGPLLMNMPEVQAFCVFVRLMETYEMRPMFTLNMAGLQLRLHQFTSLLNELLPDLAKHMNKHGVHAAMYASQWFLTLFAYVFPISLVQRIYDIVFAEGAAETIMRVAIAMLRRSQDKILQETEFEDLLDHVTSRKLCEPYADDSQVINDATSLSGIITRAKMDSLADQYNNGDKQTKFWKRKVKRSTSISSTDSLKRTYSVPSTTKKYVSLETHEQEIQKLSWTLAQLNTKHQQTINQLVELKMDMQDVESERDALKMTIMQVEKSKRHYALSVSSSSCNSIVSNQTEFAFSDTTTMTSDDGNDDDLRTELVRLKVENFELQQQNEKLTLEQEDMHARLDMVNDGQMALVEKLIATKADMDELMKEKKQKDMEWLEVTSENTQLKEQLSQLKSKLGQLMMDHTRNANTHSRQPEEQLQQQQQQIQRRRSTDDFRVDQPKARPSDSLHLLRIRELERSLAETKIRLAEHEANQQDSNSIFTVDKKRSSSVDIRPVPRSSSIYGRVWHAFTPRSSTVDR